MLILCTDVINIIIIALEEADEYIKINSVSKFFHSIIKNHNFNQWEKFINENFSTIKFIRNLLPIKICLRLTKPLKDYHSSLNFLVIGYLHHKFARHMLRIEFVKITPIINDIFTNYFFNDKHKWVKLQYLVFKNTDKTKELIITTSRIIPYLFYISEILTFLSNSVVLSKDLFQIHKKRVYNIHYSYHTLRNEVKRIDRRFKYIAKILGEGQKYFKIIFKIITS